MSDISITRFQPTTVARDKVNAVTPSDNESGGLGSSGQGHHPEQEPHKERQSDRPESATTPSDPSADDELEKAVASLNAYVQRVQRDIIFDLDNAEEPSVTVVDRSSRKVLRQIDGEEARKLAKKLDDEDHLTLFDTRV